MNLEPAYRLLDTHELSDLDLSEITFEELETAIGRSRTIYELRGYHAILCELRNADRYELDDDEKQYASNLSEWCLQEENSIKSRSFAQTGKYCSADIHRAYL